MSCRCQTHSTKGKTAYCHRHVLHLKPLTTRIVCSIAFFRIKRIKTINDITYYVKARAIVTKNTKVMKNAYWQRAVSHLTDTTRWTSHINRNRNRSISSAVFLHKKDKNNVKALAIAVGRIARRVWNNAYCYTRIIFIVADNNRRKHARADTIALQ